MAKKPKAYYPVQRHIRTRDLTAATAGGRFFQSTRLLSEANRRLYRQSYVYNLKVDLDIGSALATAGVDVYVLRNTWDLHGAYKFAMKTYYNSIKEELANAKGANTRWHDFRVQPDFQSDELEVAVNNPATTPSMNNSVLAQGDHDFSSNVDSAGTQRFFGLDNNAGANSWSIMTEWKEKDRVHSDPPSSSLNMPYGGMVENLDEANYDILRQNGAVPPYDDEADTNLWTKVATLKQTTPGEAIKLSTGFFEAPLGLVVLISSAFTTSLSYHGMSIIFQAGDYKGVKATRYATPMLTEAKEYEVV
jgi:hypothetical protein